MEDLLDVIGDVSPDETPLMTLFGTSESRGTLHEWLKYNVSRPSSVDSDWEGEDTSFADLTQPSRTSNVTHIMKQPIQVSRTERKVNVAGMGDPYAFQKADALRQLKMKMEYAILNSTRASGSSGTARTMTGVDAFITSVVTARNSGTSFSELELNDMTADAYTAVRADKVFDLVLCTVKIKQAIAGFGGNSTRYIDAAEKRLTKDILVYDSAVGSHRILHHRDVRDSAGSTTVYGLREDLHKVAYFDKPMFEELGKVGDADRGHWVTEFTLEVLEEKADLKRTGYSQNG
uniref:Putative major capsid protein n=1 Tax=viral metagenome TaxID=1070528 RepID=A0A6M3LAE8_9ZZZZ